MLEKLSHWVASLSEFSVEFRARHVCAAFLDCVECLKVSFAELSLRTTLLRRLFKSGKKKEGEFVMRFEFLTKTFAAVIRTRQYPGYFVMTSVSIAPFIVLTVRQLYKFVNDLQEMRATDFEASFSKICLLCLISFEINPCHYY